MLFCQEKEISSAGPCIRLSSLPPGQRALVISVPEHPLLYSLGLRPGKVVQCRDCQLFGGPLLIKTGDRQVALGKKIAEEITVNLI